MGVNVPIPTWPDGPKIEAVLRVVVLTDVVAITFTAVMALDTWTFPWTWSVAPRFVEVPTPTKPAVPNMAVVLRVVAFMVAV